MKFTIDFSAEAFEDDHTIDDDTAVINIQPTSYTLNVPSTSNNNSDQLYLSKSEEPLARCDNSTSDGVGVRSSLSEPSLPNLLEPPQSSTLATTNTAPLSVEPGKLSSSPLEFDLKHFESMQLVDQHLQQLEEAGVENPFTFAVISNTDTNTDTNRDTDTNAGCASEAEGAGESYEEGSELLEEEEGIDMNTSNLLRLSSSGGNAARMKVKEFVASVIDKDSVKKKKDNDLPDMNQVIKYN